MARQTYYRSDRKHAIAAENILHRHAQATGTPISLPVPIELIVEETFGLTVLYDAIDEPHGTKILGALSPETRTIILNERHENLLATVMGPERFTYAHELAHWIYDAESPGQQSLGMESVPTQDRFCYLRVSPGMSTTIRTREINANKLASHLLLPEDLVRAAETDAVLADVSGWAARWGVSRQCLQIRLQGLGLLEGDEEANHLW